MGPMSPVKVTRHPDGSWELLEDFACAVVVHPGDGALEILVPAGFRYDLASVPRFLWRLIAPFELGLAAATVHDWLYRNGGVVRSRTWRLTRAESDWVFRILIEAEDAERLELLRCEIAPAVRLAALRHHWRQWWIPRWLVVRRWAAFYGVRVGGCWGAWQGQG